MRRARSRVLPIVCALVTTALPACRRAREVPAPLPPAEARALWVLPDAVAGFSASPMVAAPDYVRRTYARGRTRIDVTLARAPLAAGGYDDWVRMSRESFPQAALDVPPADANGFYQCTERPAPSCDLLIQMRAGVHIEIRGTGTSSREDVDAIARGLPLRALAMAR